MEVKFLTQINFSFVSEEKEAFFNCNSVSYQIFVHETERISKVEDT